MAKFEYSRWRHGGWYVNNVRYPSGAIGCVSRNYPDGKWRIVCDERRRELGDERDFTFASRDAAAAAERELIATGQFSLFERGKLKEGVERESRFPLRLSTAPDAVMSAMETETDPLPDAVAAAWDTELDPPKDE